MQWKRNKQGRSIRRWGPSHIRDSDHTGLCKAIMKSFFDDMRETMVVWFHPDDMKSLVNTAWRLCDWCCNGITRAAVQNRLILERDRNRDTSFKKSIVMIYSRRWLKPGYCQKRIWWLKEWLCGGISGGTPGATPSWYSCPCESPFSSTGKICDFHPIRVC